MKIKSLQLKNFKRFTDLTLQDIPENAKLVLLIGSNGSGKSSVFDAFERIATETKEQGIAQFRPNKEYYSKDLNIEYSIALRTWDGILIKNNASLNQLAKVDSFYGRTSFRQVPRLKRKGLGTSFNIETDSDRPLTYIDRDERFENDLEHIFGKLLREYFITKNTSEIYDKVLNPINQAFKRIFNENEATLLQLENIIPPLEGKIAEITFNKGNSFFQYNQLSAGEKEVFNILIDFVARKEYYTNTIYFFDEIDLHLNTKLQYNFLKEIVEHWISDNCQFWTASHSLGFIQYAKEAENAIILDFDDYDFDYTKILSPVTKDSSEVYEIAVNKELLPQLFEDYKIVFVENKDRYIYSELNIQHTLFIQENGKSGVYHKVKNGNFSGIIDRDFLTDDDIIEIEKHYTTTKILRLYSIENYLFHPENLSEYFKNENSGFNEEEYKKNLLDEKNTVIDELIRKLAITRTSYPFFKEPEFNADKNQKRFTNSAENFTEVAIIEKYIRSNVFEDFYKVFPMKDYATQLKERQNISKIDLAKTNWFKKQIEQLLT
jgi:hypothetical protein